MFELVGLITRKNMVGIMLTSSRYFVISTTIILLESKIREINHFSCLFIYMSQSSSEHPLGKAIVEYARHFHFFDESSAATGTKDTAKEIKAGWLYDVSDFSALPGRGVQCLLHGKRILVRPSCCKKCPYHFLKYCELDSYMPLVGSYQMKNVLIRLVTGS